MSDREIGPRVTIELTYDQALRLSYVVHFPQAMRPDDGPLVRLVDQAIADAEAIANAV